MGTYGRLTLKLNEKSSPISVREYLECLRECGFGLYEAMDDLDKRAAKDGYDGPAFYSILCDVYADWEPERKRKYRYITSEHSVEEWEEKKRQYNQACFYCGKRVVRLTKDHIIPITQDGNDRIENIVPACWPCNRRKRAKALAEFKEGATLKLL